MNIKEKIELILKTKYNNTLTKHNVLSFISTLQHQLKDEINKEITENINFSEKIYIIMNKMKSSKRCKCGKKVKFYSIISGYGKFCSRKCIKINKQNDKNRIEKIKQTKLERYGNKSYCNIEKIKQTKLENHGNENYNNRKKSKITCLKLYGNKNYVNRNQTNITNLKKYGSISPAFDKNVKNKIKKSIHKNFYKSLLSSNRLKGLVEPMFYANEYNGNDWNNKYRWKCCKCNNIFEDNIDDGRIPRCLKCYPKHINTSKAELEISTWLNKIGIEHIKNDRTIIYPLELDIVIPSKKIAIEFNGIYWHSELQGKNKNYHLNKTNQCNEKGYQLIHIFEDEWNEKKEIVKSIIKAKLGIFDQKIYGRKCQIKKLNYTETKIFLNNNHIQGEVRSSINYGLFYQNELVALATFGKSRFRTDKSFELLRFCSKLNTQVLGALSKLVSAWKNEYPNKTLISYADKRYSNGIGYESSGFNLIGESQPNYKYFKDGKLESRMKYQKHKISKLLENFNSELTEWQNMQLNGYDRIWDCGNYVFKKSS